MKKALVIGATGGTGRAILNELIHSNIDTIAFGRSKEKLMKLGASPFLSFYEGDAFNCSSVADAAKDVDVIFQCAAVPYHSMEERQLDLGYSIMKAAHHLKKKIVFVDGIYPYGDVNGLANEETAKRPNTRKGKVKLDLENLIFSNDFKESTPLIVRLPDYYGPTANQNSYLASTLFGIAKNQPSVFIGNLKTKREYVYLPDAAKMIVKIADTQGAYRQNWNIPGSGTISGKEIIRIAQSVAEKKRLVIPLGKISLSLLGLFVKDMGEIVEMLYLTKRPVILDSHKYEKNIGKLPRTSFETGIRDTIRSLTPQV